MVTDVCLPEISRIPLAALNASGRHQGPAVVISGHVDVPMAAAAIKVGACTLPEKPISPPVLVEAIDAALAARQPMSTALPAPDLVKGADSKMTARVLGISPRPVAVFRANEPVLSFQRHLVLNRPLGRDCPSGGRVHGAIV
jgi:FixJ family two-component response regulator